MYNVTFHVTTIIMNFMFRPSESPSPFQHCMSEMLKFDQTLVPRTYMYVYVHVLAGSTINTLCYNYVPA